MRTFRKLDIEVPVKHAQPHDIAHNLQQLAEKAPAGSLLGGDDVETFPALSFKRESSTFRVYIEGGRIFTVTVREGA
jgi:hypothetical protein